MRFFSSKFCLVSAALVLLSSTLVLAEKKALKLADSERDDQPVVDPVFVEGRVEGPAVRARKRNLIHARVFILPPYRLFSMLMRYQFLPCFNTGRF
jgi:hypothetical protein